MSEKIIISECIMKECNTSVFNGKFLCKKHWKDRRKTKAYKYDDYK